MKKISPPLLKAFGLLSLATILVLQVVLPTPTNAAQILDRSLTLVAGGVDGG